MGDFKTDLVRGQVGEDKVKQYFEIAGYYIIKNESKLLFELKGWDLQIGSTKVEVKRDMMFARTGNIAVEVGCLNTTKSTRWIYVLGSDLRITNPECLNNMQGRLIYGGDGGRTLLKLVKVEEFYRLSKELKYICIVEKVVEAIKTRNLERLLQLNRLLDEINSQLKPKINEDSSNCE